MVLKFKKSMKTVLLSMIGLLMAVSAIAQTGQTNVKGTVRDVKGEPIIGATILLQGTTVGTATDMDGNFSLQAPGNGVLEVSYIGYKSEVVPIENRTNIQIVLHEDTEV